MNRIDDLRIVTTRPLLPPAILIEEIPASERAAATVAGARDAVTDLIRGSDSRLLAVVGPCSVHDVDAALDYAARLKPLADRYADDLLIVMRAYFDKPRTTVGWKGLINDPDLDESFHINKGLRLARKLLLEINELGLPAGTEFLDLTVPQHIADLVAWGAIGARTTESQTHRALVSGLSMPVGFKNATDGNYRVAIDAVQSARAMHWFPSNTKQGVAAIFQTTGNDTCHIILRGGKSGPNYDAVTVDEVGGILRGHGLPDRVLIDCSHGNSAKDHRRQPLVCDDVAGQVRRGSRGVLGVMIESFLVDGRQDYVPGEPATYGQSVTDACVDLAATEAMLEGLAAAHRDARPG